METTDTTPDILLAFSRLFKWEDAIHHAFEAEDTGMLIKLLSHPGCPQPQWLSALSEAILRTSPSFYNAIRANLPTKIWTDLNLPDFISRSAQAGFAEAHNDLVTQLGVRKQSLPLNDEWAQNYLQAAINGGELEIWAAALEHAYKADGDSSIRSFLTPRFWQSLFDIAISCKHQKLAIRIVTDAPEDALKDQKFLLGLASGSEQAA